MSIVKRRFVRFIDNQLRVELAENYMQLQSIRDENIPPRGAEILDENYFNDKNIRPFDLLRLVRDIGHQIGLSGGDIQHLDYLISHTREVDWVAGERPIVYKSVCKMARERGVSERQIHHREAKLHALGCIAWNDMGNFRRTGGRKKDGRIAFAYGVDLSPLARRYDEFAIMKEKQIEDLAAFDAARRSLSSTRRRILVKITRAQDAGVDVSDTVEQFSALAQVRARTSSGSLDTILTCANDLETTLDETLLSCGLTQKTSDQPEENFRHIQPTNNPQSSKDDTCNPRVDDGKEDVGKKSTGSEHLEIRQVINATGDNFIAYMRPIGRKVCISDVVDAAGRLCHDLGVHKSAWADACSVMGRMAAAIAIIIIDRNMSHPECPIQNPGGVLRAMTARARIGELHLHRSIFGILERDRKSGMNGGMR